jgi:hypothetical protein
MNLIYDEFADALYVTLRAGAADQSIEDDNGCVWRFCCGELISLTMTAFVARLDRDATLIQKRVNAG